ncbi:hypothetical protein M422DRAFT_196896, partial [Sphaerobolus stellatus SS14]
FFEKCAVFVSVLDSQIHTPRAVLERDGFLFTVVCTIASRYLTSRPNLHSAALHFAKHLAATSLINGVKSVEMAQAYLLMSVYGLPARRWEEDRSWFYGGLAGRIATDLNLNLAPSSTSGSTSSTTKPLSERHERERMNRTRTWLNCWNVDRSSAVQFGKPTGLEEDETVRGAKAWYRSGINKASGDKYDVHLVAFTELLMIMTRFHERVGVAGAKVRFLLFLFLNMFIDNDGLLLQRDLRAATEATEAELQAWRDAADWSYEHESDKNG